METQRKTDRVIGSSGHRVFGANFGDFDISDNSPCLRASVVKIELRSETLSAHPHLIESEYE
jgi:hypothetical protein